MSVYFKGYHWPHILFFGITPIVAIGGVTWVIGNGGPHWGTWVLAAVLFVIIGLAITSGYHRLFAHRSYEASWPIRLLYLLLGAAAFEGSVRWWACQHRYHHLYTDTERDPYGINKGFWYAHIGWLFTSDQESPSYQNVPDLDADPSIRFQDRFFIPLAILIGFIFPTLLASLWGDPWGGFFVAGLARMVLNHHATFCVNSVCHYFGNQTYSDRNSARDSWLAAVITFGEGYHNFHHEFQYDYRNGVRAFQWDPTKWLIRFLSWTGLADHLRQARWDRIMMAKIEMDQKRVVGLLAGYSDAGRIRIQELMTLTQNQLQQAYTRFQTLKTEYYRIKGNRIDSMNAKIDDLRLELHRARREFKLALARWRSLINTQVEIPLTS